MLLSYNVMFVIEFTALLRSVPSGGSKSWKNSRLKSLFGWGTIPVEPRVLTGFSVCWFAYTVCPPGKPKSEKSILDKVVDFCGFKFRTKCCQVQGSKRWLCVIVSGRCACVEVWSECEDIVNQLWTVNVPIVSLLVRNRFTFLSHVLVPGQLFAIVFNIACKGFAT